MKKFLIKPLLLAAVAILLQSCFAAKTYERPNVANEVAFRVEDSIAAANSLSLMNWQSLFTDPMLQQHINTGINHNLDMQIALQNIEAARATLKQRKAAFGPSVNLGADWTHQELSKNSQFGRVLPDRSVDQYQLAANLSWEADIWGRIRSDKRAAQAQLERNVSIRQAIQTQIVAGIASTYFQLMALDAQLEVVEKTLENRVQSIEVIQALKESGYTNEVGVKQTEAQYYQTQIIAGDIRTQIVLLENSLSILMGQNPQSVARSRFENQSVQADLQTGIPAELLQNRPDVRAAELQLISAFEFTNVARSQFYPTLRLTGSGGFQSVDINQWFSANALFANVVTGLTQPLFNQRNIRSNYERAQANQQIASIQFKQSLLEASREVSDAIQQYDNESKKLDIRAKQLDALRKAADFSDELLTYGMVNYLEVLTAKDQALNTELSTIDNAYRKYDALISLYRALGGGWQ